MKQLVMPLMLMTKQRVVDNVEGEDADNCGETVSDVDAEVEEVVASGAREVLDEGDAEKLDGIVRKESDKTTRFARKRDPSQSKYSNHSKPKPETNIRYMLRDGCGGQARVLSRQPKRTGGSRDWVKVLRPGKDEPSSINWNQVSWWKTLASEETVLLLSETDECKQVVIDAKEKEFSNLCDHNVFQWVDDVGLTTVSCKWVITEKERNGVTLLKARLVARGFEEVVECRTESPTCSRQALRMVFVSATSMSWKLESLDITSAFLQGNLLERDVFVRPPAEYREKGKVWKLMRCIYGLNDAPREWYNRVEEVLKNFGGKKSRFDSAMFLWYDDDECFCGIVVTHVDDFIYSDTSNWRSSVIDGILTIFKVNKQEC